MNDNVLPRYTPAPCADMECALRAVFEIFGLSSDCFVSCELVSDGGMSRPRAIWTHASEALFVALAKEGRSAPFIAKALAQAGQAGASQATVGRRLAEWRGRRAPLESEQGPPAMHDVSASPLSPASSAAEYARDLIAEEAQARKRAEEAARIERLKVSWLYS